MKINELLAAIRDRTKTEPFGYGISTADRYLKSVVQCLGDSACASAALDGISVDMVSAAIKESESLFTYCDDTMDVCDEPVKATGTSGFEAILKRIKAGPPPIPKHTAMVMENIITATREDRDRDVMESEGAVLDMKMLLLWQHIPLQPIGKMLGLVEQNKKWVKVVSCILDINKTCSDAIKFIEAEAMRFSHGFKPIKYAPLVSDNKDIDRPPGFHVQKFEIVEESLVSVPANIDAVVTLFSRGKLSSPLVKAWAKSFFDSRSPIVPGTSGKYGVTEKLGEYSRKLEFADELSMKRYLSGSECECKNKGSTPKFEKTKSSASSKWNAVAATKRLQEWAKGDDSEIDFAKYARGFAYVKDSEEKSLADFALPHHDIENGEISVVLRGVSAAIAALNDSRGGVKWDNESDRKKAYAHLAKHYKQFEGAGDPPELKSWDEYKGRKPKDDDEEDDEEVEDVMMCPDCDSEIPADSKVCPECGAKIRKARKLAMVHEFARLAADGDYEVSVSKAVVANGAGEESVLIASAVPSGSSGHKICVPDPKAYIQLKGSWEWITSKLRATVKERLTSIGVKVESDPKSDEYVYVSIEAMFDDRVLMSVSRRSGLELYASGWKMDNGVPKWSGTTKPVELETVIAEKSAIRFIGDRIPPAAVEFDVPGMSSSGAKSLSQEIVAMAFDASVDDLDVLKSIGSVISAAIRDLEAEKADLENKQSELALAEFLGFVEPVDTVDKGNPNRGPDGRFTSKPSEPVESLSNTEGRNITTDELASRITSQMQSPPPQ